MIIHQLSTPILNLACKELVCEYKTNNTQSLVDHNREVRERNVCKDCNTITVGTAQKKNKNGKLVPHRHAPKKTPAQKNRWVQPKQIFINRKIKHLQKEVNILKTDQNLFNHLHNIPEIIDSQKIHFSKKTREKTKIISTQRT